eukprot:COSAG01_NODE_3251_length_6331_cov_8.087944_7_plen_85_part_00
MHPLSVSFVTGRISNKQGKVATRVLAHMGYFVGLLEDVNWIAVHKCVCFAKLVAAAAAADAAAPASASAAAAPAASDHDACDTL